MKEETKKKIDNFWFYYKTHVFVGIFILVVAIVCIYSMSSVQKLKYDRTVLLMGQNMDDSKRSSVESELSSNVILLQLSSTADAKTQTDVVDLFAYYNLKGKYEVGVIDKDQYQSFAKKGSFVKLDSYIKDGKLNNAEGVEAKTEKSDTEATYGIKLNSSKILDELKFDTKDKVIVIYANSKNVNKDIDIINTINK